MLLLIFHVILSFSIHFFVHYVYFSIYLAFKYNDIPEHLWYNLENLITYLLTHNMRGILHEKNITS